MDDLTRGMSTMSVDKIQSIVNRVARAARYKDKYAFEAAVAQLRQQAFTEPPRPNIFGGRQERNLEEVQMPGDGNCLYYAIIFTTWLKDLPPGNDIIPGYFLHEQALAMLQSDKRYAAHQEVRDRVIKAWEEGQALFGCNNDITVLTKDIQKEALKRLRDLTAWADAPVIAMIACVFHLKITILGYEGGMAPQVFDGSGNVGGRDIFLKYVDKVHYNALVEKSAVSAKFLIDQKWSQVQKSPSRQKLRIPNWQP